MKENSKSTLRQVITLVCFVLIVITAILITIWITQSASNSKFSGTRSGYAGEEDSGYWTASYRSLNGTLKKKMKPEGDILHISVETNAGTLSIVIKDMDNNVIFQTLCDKSETYDVAIPEKISVQIDAEQHSGSFCLESGL